MPRLDVRYCACCGRSRDEAGPLSWSRLCGECGEALQAENIVGITTKSGYAHKRRLRGYAKWLEGALLDEPQARP